MAAAGTVSTKPLLRGWSCAAATVPALLGSLVLLGEARGDPGLESSLLVYGSALVLLFAASAGYHLPPWSPSWRSRLRRVDHSMIFVMIAATYTPIAGTVLGGWTRALILVAVWTLALLGIALTASPVQLPRFGLALAYLAVGWVAVAALPALVAAVGARGLVLLLAGGILYSAGAVVYALRRPGLWPRVFGYHELFHLLVIAATAMFFAFIANDVIAAHRS